MFMELDLSLVRERRDLLLREVNGHRLEGRLLANRDREFRPGRLRRAAGAFLPRRFTDPPARSGRVGAEGTMPKKA